jgi:Flp pilus assembly protein TadD
MSAAAQEQFSAAVTALREGRPEQAEKMFRALLAGGADLPQVHQNLGISLQRLRRHEEAVEQFRQVLNADPQARGARALLGSSLMALGRLEEAVAQLEQAVEEMPEDQLVRRELGRAYSAQGRPLEAVRQYRELARLAPEDPEYAYLLGEAYLAVVQWSYSRLVGSAPESARVYQGLAQNLAAAGNLEGAAQALEKAVGLAPDLPDLHLLLATVYLRQGRHAEALAAVQGELQLVPENQGARQIKEFLERQIQSSPANP